MKLFIEDICDKLTLNNNIYNILTLVIINNLNWFCWEYYTSELVNCRHSIHTEPRTWHVVLLYCLSDSCVQSGQTYLFLWGLSSFCHLKMTNHQTTFTPPLQTLCPDLMVALENTWPAYISSFFSSSFFFGREHPLAVSDHIPYWKAHHVPKHIYSCFHSLSLICISLYFPSKALIDWGCCAIFIALQYPSPPTTAPAWEWRMRRKLSLTIWQSWGEMVPLLQDETGGCLIMPFFPASFTQED